MLHGVTGSGKTEVYLQAIQQVLDDGKEAIMLVPEISLTPQMTERFRSRFGEMVAVMHSGLSVGEKYDEWRRIQQGKVKVVVGARSAIFAPLEILALLFWMKNTNQHINKKILHVTMQGMSPFGVVRFTNVLLF